MNIKLDKYEIFPSLLIVLTYALLILDAVKYPGFIGNHFFIDAKIYSAIVIVLLLFVNTKSKILDFVLKINTTVLILSSIIYVFFSYLEGSHYQNFVLSSYHFHLDGLVFVVLFSLSIFLISKFKSKESKPIKIKNSGYYILMFLIAYTLVSNVGTSLSKSLSGDIYVFTHIEDSYDQKMFFQWGNFYNYMVFVKNNTPENAGIVIPPEIAPWFTRTGSAQLVRHFLYPRKLIQFETAEIPDLKSLPGGTYIMIAWGDWECERYGCGVWPEQTIKAKEAILKDPDSSRVKEIRENFIYDPKDTTTPFGLLKI